MHAPSVTMDTFCHSWENGAVLEALATIEAAATIVDPANLEHAAVR